LLSFVTVTANMKFFREYNEWVKQTRKGHQSALVGTKIVKPVQVPTSPKQSPIPQTLRNNLLRRTNFFIFSLKSYISNHLSKVTNFPGNFSLLMTSLIDVSFDPKIKHLFLSIAAFERDMTGGD